MRGFSGKKAIWIVIADPVHSGEWGGGPEKLKEVAQKAAAAARSAVTNELKPNISPQPHCFTQHGTVDDCDKLMLFEKMI